MSAPESRRRLDLPPAALRHLVAVRPDYFPALFDSAASAMATPHGARTLLAAAPVGQLAMDRDLRLVARGEVTPAPASSSGFLDALEAWWRGVHRRGPAATGLAGGWVVYLGYEVASEIEPTLRLPRGRLPWRALALRVRGALVHDHVAGTIELTVAAGDEPWLDEIEAQVVAALATPLAATTPILATPLEEEPPGKFLARVARAQEHIGAGDIYQANLSRWWRAPCPAATAPWLYERLRLANPAPFAAFARFDGMDLLSSSPERLLGIQGRDVSTRPIAGTRPRSLRPGEDAHEAAGLVAHPKERAEHVMLIDLERNDLGRVCEAGTVRVDEYMAVETYAHVHHIVSNVRGSLRAGVTPIGALRAVFPGGTITGVPKVRCMQIIAELEGEGRDAYTGSLGWMSIAGDADFNILIRTLTLADGQLEVRAGAGIVADSDPARELEETRAKARGLLVALGRDG
ncbi:MAG: Aminodeoxychorismate synthase component 1 [Steroidobacteraceae bacterium]|nr:Aminodeoxychorismate synthase component 1 [Steroidobacteraceae bacterium]